MAEVEPEVVETVEAIEPTVEPTVEPEPEPEPEKKKRKKRDDAPVRAPRVRRVAPKPSVVREELPPDPPLPTEVDANFFVQLGHNLRALEKESRQRRLSALEIV
jgi:cell division protein FtsN